MVADARLPEEGTTRRAIVEVGRRMYQRGYVAANDGNISARLPDGDVLMTPTGVSKGFMSTDQLIKIDMAGQRLEGHLEASSEIWMHLAIYEAREEVRAVVHAHPPVSTGFAVAGVPLDKCVLAEVILSLGAIPVAEFQPPSTRELATSTARYMASHDALLLANHGALTVGREVMDAYFKMETLEHFAQITMVARTLGGEHLLSPREVQQVIQLRDKYGAGEDLPQCRTCDTEGSEGQVCGAEEAGSAAAPEEDRRDLVERVMREVMRRLGELNR